MTTIVVSRTLLAAALNDAARIIDKRQTIPILGNVRVEVQDGQMIVTATDLDLVWRSTFAVDGGLGADDVDTTIPATRLADILKRASGDTVSLVLEDGKSVTVRAGKARWTMPVLPSTDFPTGEEREPTHHFRMAAADFAAALSATAFAAAGPKDGRVQLQGVHMECRDGKLWFIATDGHRMPVYPLAAPAGAEGFPDMNIPDTVTGHLLKAASGSTGEIELLGHRERLFLEMESGGRKIRIATKLLEGTYPDWRRLLVAHGGGSRVARVDRSTLAAACTRVAISSSAEKGRCVAFALSDEAIRLHVRSIDGEEAEDEVEASGEGEAMTVGMNAAYVAEVLDAMPDGQVELQASSPSTAVRFCVPDNADRLTIVMPMSIAWASPAKAA